MSQQQPLREQLKALEQLQELDLKIDQIKKNKAAMPVALKGLEDVLAKARLQVTAKKSALEEVEKTMRQTRAAMDLNQDRMGRSSGRLDGVRNSNEFNAANKEIEQLKKLGTSLEEQMKKGEQDVQALQRDLSALEGQMNKAQQERDAQANLISAESGKLDGDIAKLTAERAQFTVKVEARTLALYDRVRGARAGMGIAPAIAGRCKACNMMVPPQQFNEICKCQTLHSCPSCNRILFAAQQPSG